MFIIIIESAFDFLELAHNLKNNRSHPSEIEFYRGHSNKQWKLLPSIFRINMLPFEKNLINEFIRRKPNEFFKDNGTFDIVAKMQHYGLKTRLLDVTENPAVALYFACQDNFNEDGEIFTFQRSLDDIPNNKVVNGIMDFYINYKDKGGNYNVESFYNKAIQEYNESDLTNIFYYIINGYNCFSRPKIISDRMLRQKGAFMLFTNEVNQKERYSLFKIKNKLNKLVKNLSIKRNLPDYTNKHIHNEQEGKRYIIKGERKKEILNQLNTIGINKVFLFPELSNEGVDIMEDYCSRVK